MPPELVREVTVLLLGVAAVLAAAKSHGEQVRLRREHEGHAEASFRGGNHPWVEALWRRDRRRFWFAFALLGAVAVLAASLALAAGAFPLPRLLAIPVALGWAFAASFAVTGFAWRAELRRLGAPAGWGFVGWTGLALAFVLAQAWLVWWGP